MADDVARLFILCGWASSCCWSSVLQSADDANLLRIVIALEVLSKATTLALVATGYATGQVGLVRRWRHAHRRRSRRRRRRGRHHPEHLPAHRLARFKPAENSES